MSCHKAHAMNENDLLEFMHGSCVLFEWYFKGTWCLVTNQWSQQSGKMKVCLHRIYILRYR